MLNPNHPTNKKNPFLYRIKTREKIEVKGELFRIGREKTFVNYCISNNDAVSSSHAYIAFKNNKYYLVDTNSTNHTYLNYNNTPIPSNVETELSDGDKILFADEEFEFKF